MKLFECYYYTPAGKLDQMLVVAEDYDEAKQEVAAVYHARHDEKPAATVEEYVSVLSEVESLADRKGRCFRVELRLRQAGLKGGEQHV